MSERRVVVTGMAGITSLGTGYETVEQKLREGRSGIRHMPEWDKYRELNTRLCGPVPDFVTPAHYSRKDTRTMSRVSVMAVRATELALIDAGLKDDPEIKTGAMGVSYGSCMGGLDALNDFASMMGLGTSGQLTATTYVRFMTHTAAVNIGIYFGLKGRIIPTASACTSGSQGVGYAYEAIKYGQQTMMVAGGAEEESAPAAAVFDTLFATSQKNHAPQTTPRPFDQERDGLVIGEGASTLVLEEYEHARARGAKIHCEIVAFGTNSDGKHATNPDSQMMQAAMELALNQAGLPPSAIGYVSAHGTATDAGDVAESQATHRLFGSRLPISSMKSYFGHTLGACGAIESWLAIEMLKRGWYAPTLNLKRVDPRCGELDYIQGAGRKLDCEYVMNNNFAFGGINTSLIFRRLA